MLRRMTVLKTILIVAMLLLAVGPVLAGGWAVITVDSLPKDVHAGDNVHLEFMVRQHGKDPVHSVDFMNSEPLIPVLQARHTETGQTIRVEAKPAKEVGRFTVDFVFPVEGSWQWEITPYPLEGTIELEPLTVLAPLAAAVTASQQPVQEESTNASPSVNLSAGRTILRWSGLILLLAAAVTTLLAWRQRQHPLPSLTTHLD